MTLTTVGYGDVTPVTDAERAYLVVTMMFGGICYSYIIASMASIVSPMDSNERLFNEKMDCVASYMGKNNFPELLYKVPRHIYLCRQMQTYYFSTNFKYVLYKTVTSTSHQAPSRVV